MFESVETFWPSRSCRRATDCGDCPILRPGSTRKPWLSSWLSSSFPALSILSTGDADHPDDWKFVRVGDCSRGRRVFPWLHAYGRVHGQCGRGRGLLWAIARRDSGVAELSAKVGGTQYSSLAPQAVSYRGPEIGWFHANDWSRGWRKGNPGPVGSEARTWVVGTSAVSNTADRITASVRVITHKTLPRKGHGNWTQRNCTTSASTSHATSGIVRRSRLT